MDPDRQALFKSAAAEGLQKRGCICPVDVVSVTWAHGMLFIEAEHEIKCPIVRQAMAQWN